MKRVNLRKVVGMVSAVALLLSIGVLSTAMAEKPTQKPVLPEQAKGKEPKLIWKKTFDGGIDFSMSNDANFILVHSAKWDGDNVKVARYLLDKTGKTIQKEENEGLYTKEGRMDWKDTKKGRLEGVISGDGEYIRTARGIENRRGQLLSKGRFMISEAERPAYSPSGKYIAVVPGYEVDHPFLRIYDTKSGKLLWSYESKSQGFLTASFISNEKLVVYTEGKVILYDTRSGKKHWGKILIENPLEMWRGPYADMEVELSTSENGDIAVYHRKKDTIYSLSEDGSLRWKCKGKAEFPSLSWDNIKLSNKGNYLAVVSKHLDFFNNKTGDLLWQKRYAPSGTWLQSVVFYPNDKYLLIAGFLYEGEFEVERDTMCNTYLLDKSGKVIWQFKSNKPIGTSPPILQLSTDGNNLAIQDNENLYLFDILSLKEDE